ncbi:helix-turn-helix domain-containing protein [Nocardioides humilatus]|uniref:Helix-turn-helix domain-containing protein n=1 Tax=Nocardioides humilatus TaxID=2607660 RepID=A0A5B1L5S1_9ACTN|nr:helix-turn-helix domain-containing protein [Nocardioides humilatus]KAA1414997.1 helix-turn-helix domain-containing protein [Nocardioides humilatus]
MTQVRNPRKPREAEARADGYVTLQEAADYYQVSTDSLRRYIAQGAVPAVRLPGRAIRIKRSDLDKLARRIPTYRGSL